jgi:hypothetical protein
VTYGSVSYEALLTEPRAAAADAGVLADIPDAVPKTAAYTYVWPDNPPGAGLAVAEDGSFKFTPPTSMPPSRFVQFEVIVVSKEPAPRAWRILVGFNLGGWGRKRPWGNGSLACGLRGQSG